MVSCEAVQPETMRRLLLSSTICAIAFSQDKVPDPRHISNGWVIPDEGYSDQPYIVRTGDGAWLCAITTGPGQEGASGQHVVTQRSTDFGRTWRDRVDVEPSNGPEASYAVILRVPSGRVYVFYNHNTDNIREVISDSPGGKIRRVDSLGHFVFKYSDDHGRTWSAKRYEIPQRDFEIDRNNPYRGKIKFFWTVGKALIHKGAGYVPLHKVGGFGEGFFTSNEGVLLRSSNLLTERDPETIQWETLPEGDVGIRAPAGVGGPIASEHSFSELSDGSLFTVFRTIDGHAAFSYSRNSGRTWEPSQYMRYADGRLMKHPRAANFAWKTANGRYLYWFHNHGGRFIREHPRRRTIAYEDRNPVWLAGGEEVDGRHGKVIRWTQPEIVLYDDDPIMRMSYPDLVEESGRYFLTETQKEIARTHEIDPSLLSGLWSQFVAREVTRKGLLFEQKGELPAAVPAPHLPAFLERQHGGHGTKDLRSGFTVEFRLTPGSTAAGQTLLDNRTPDGKGFVVRIAEAAAVEIAINDGRTENRWASDPGALRVARPSHVAILVDSGPKIISFVIDGRFHDGGDTRQFGWGRFSRDLRGLEGSKEIHVHGLSSLRLYGRALRVSEAIANFHSGE
jgi:hypothetical protein